MVPIVKKQKNCQSNCNVGCADIVHRKQQEIHNSFPRSSTIQKIKYDMKAADQYCNCKRMETFEVYKIIMVSFAVQLLQSQ